MLTTQEVPTYKTAPKSDALAATRSPETSALATSRVAKIPDITDAQKAELLDLGFLSMERVTSPEDVAAIRSKMESLFANKTGYKEGEMFITTAPEENADEAVNIVQIMRPQQYADALRKTEYFTNAFALAQQVLGPEARFSYDHVLLKPAGGPSTPWHQDEAFHDPSFRYDEVHVWMPLQAVDNVNGCMEFIPRSQHKILPHRSPNNDTRIHGLECCGDFDPKQAVACPLPAGGCTLHLARTLHYTSPNRSNAPRFAYVLVFELPPVFESLTRSFPWQEAKNTARMKRQREWRLRDGRFLALWRKMKSRSPEEYLRFALKTLRKAGILSSQKQDK